MCGIAGQISFKNYMPDMTDTMRSMCDTLVPRGPDAGGEYYDENAYLVHRRLIVIDPENGQQPMCCGNYVIVYNGELYNTDEVRDRLKQRNVPFNGHSDTEVVLKAYIEYGEKCLEYFNGIYAFAIWNNRTRNLFLARDRIGVKPLYYSFVDGGIVFASEIKAILKHPMVKPIIDRHGIYEIMLMGPAVGKESAVFRDIAELPPAHCATYDEDGYCQRKYWHLKAQPHNENFRETMQHTRELLIDAVRKQLVSDVPLCCFLSGGLDSSVISAIAAEDFKNKGKVLSTYSIDYKDNHKNFKASSFQPDEDAPWIRRMVEYIGSEHTDIVLDTPALAYALNDSTYARDLPGMADVDSSLYLFCKEIKKRFPVALSGECADEVFGGYPWYHKAEILNYNGFPWSTAVVERAKLMKLNVSVSESEEFVNRYYNECISQTDYLDDDTPYERRMREMYMLNLEYFMCTLLTRKDRMSMAHGLEVRVPFCDHRIVEYAYNIPWDMKSYNGREKGLVRAAMEGILPSDVLWRKKSPYPKTHNPDYNELLINKLSELLRSDNERITEIVSADELNKMLASKGSTFNKNWYGQLMTAPQIFAYFLQIDAWLKQYNIIISE